MSVNIVKTYLPFPGDKVIDSFMLEILLIRHGQTDWNVEKRIMGHHPIPLNETGILQARKLAEYLKPHSLDKIYTSPHLRAMQTAKYITEDRNLELVEANEIREIEHGEWVGKTFAEIRALPAYVPYYSAPHLPMGKTGESLENVRLRGAAFIDKIRQEIGQGRVALVTHADWIKCVLLHYMKIPLTQLSQFRIDNASISCLHFEAKHERVICVNHGVEAERLFGHKEFL